MFVKIAVLLAGEHGLRVGSNSRGNLRIRRECE